MTPPALTSLGQTQEDVNTSFVDLFKTTFKDIPDHYEELNKINSLCNSTWDKVIDTHDGMDELYAICRGTHKIFNFTKGPMILSSFKKFSLKAINLCIYNDEEIDFV